MVMDARAILLRPSYEAVRRKFITELPRVLGVVPVVGFLPHRDDLTTSVCPWSGKVWTADATMSGQLAPVGTGGIGRSFVSASSRYLVTPDAADLSFGNGTVDSAFSIVVLANVTDTAAVRTFTSKNAAGNDEYVFRVNTGDTLSLFLIDSSVAASPERRSTVVIVQGRPVLLAATYSVATGGATAADDVTLYQSGEPLASTALNAGTYVAMENLVSPLDVGAVAGHTLNFLDGMMAFLAIVPRALSAADHAAVAALCRRTFGGA